MAFSFSPKAVTDGLVFCLDAANTKSYPRTGTVWSDLTSNRINGTLTNGPTFSSENGGSLVFDQTDDYVTLGTPTLLNGVQVPLTIMAWAKLANTTGFRTIYGAFKNTSTNNLYSLLRVDNGILRYFASTAAGGYQYRDSFTITANVWNFYTVVVSGTLVSPSVGIYLNDSFQVPGSYSAFSANPSLTVDFRVGGNQDSLNQAWNGNIANIQIYNRALLATEVLQNYNALKGRFNLT